MTIDYRSLAAGVIAACALAATNLNAQQAGTDLGGQLAPPLCDYGAPSSDAAPELSQFDFLIGDFTITGRIWQGEDWGPVIDNPRPRLVGRYILGGTAIADEWYDTDPGINPQTTRGLTTRFYDSEAGEWKVSWMGSRNPQITDLRVSMVDGLLTMRTEYPATPNYDAYFERTGPDSWTRTAFRTEEDGSRTLLWQAIATRIPCD